MNESKQIQDWQEKIRATFGDANQLYQYLFETMDNFYYRYMETTDTKSIKTQELGSNKWGAYSFESNMVEALKISHPEIKAGIIDLAKAIPKAQRPMVRYGLWVEIKDFTADHGHLALNAEINWGFPDYNSCSNVIKKVDFKYDDLGQFRKQLALKLEEACELFA